MKNVFISTGRHLDRRTLLKGIGASLALPMLDAMTPAFAKSQKAVTVGGDGIPRRMIAINCDLGFMPEEFFPTNTGRDYTLSPYLAELKAFRDQFTVFSGVSHPYVDGGHQADVCFLTGAPNPRSAGFKNTVSLDQYAAEHIGPQTRFRTINLGVGRGAGSLAYTGDGVRIPSEYKPSKVYEQLFIEGSPEEIELQVRKLKEGQSLMDSFGEKIKSLKNDVSGPDRDRLEQYFNSVREVEKRLAQSEGWEKRPKPETDIKPPKDITDGGALVARMRNMYDLSKLAFETDSTRLITIYVTQNFNPKVDLPGVELPHHALTHQSQVEDSHQQLKTIETAQMKELAKMMEELNAVSEDGDTLLDRTMILQGSTLGHAGKHDNRNMPMLLAGGGFKHGQHLAFDKVDNEPLANLYVSMLQRLGIETDRFSSGTKPMTGLEMV